MKLLVTSDWHDDAVTLGVPRRAEILRYVDELRHVCVLEKVDVVVFPGDFADPGGMLASLYASDSIQLLPGLAAETRSKRGIVVAGNHDVVETSQTLTTLSPLAAVTAARCGVSVAETSSLVYVDDVCFLCLPYQARAAGAEVLPLGLFDACLGARAAGQKIVSVSHLNVPGARRGSEVKEMSRGRDVDLPVEQLLELRPDLVINGHYHRPQVVDVSGLEVLIPGSPLAFTTDDDAGGKGYTIVEGSFVRLVPRLTRAEREGFDVAAAVQALLARGALAAVATPLTVPDREAALEEPVADNLEPRGEVEDWFRAIAATSSLGPEVDAARELCLGIVEEVGL